MASALRSLLLGRTRSVKRVVDGAFLDVAGVGSGSEMADTLSEICSVAIAGVACVPGSPRGCCFAFQLVNDSR